MVWDKKEFSKELPPLKEITDDGARNLATAVIYNAARSVYRIEKKRWKHWLSVGVCSSSIGEQKEMKDCIRFFKDDLQFYADILGIDTDWKVLLRSIIQRAHEQAKKEVPGS